MEVEHLLQVGRLVIARLRLMVIKRELRREVFAQILRIRAAGGGELRGVRQAVAA